MPTWRPGRSEEHTSELQSHVNLVCRLLLEKKNLNNKELIPGAKLYLQVFVPGVLFSCGDGHGAQGDGEVCVTAIEFFFFNDTATTEIYTLSLHDALPI